MCMGRKLRNRGYGTEYEIRESGAVIGSLERVVTEGATHGLASNRTGLILADRAMHSSPKRGEGIKIGEASGDFPNKPLRVCGFLSRVSREYCSRGSSRCL